MANIGPTIKQKAAKVYLPEWKYNKLAGVLRARGTDVSKWFRDKVDEELGLNKD